MQEKQTKIPKAYDHSGPATMFSVSGRNQLELIAIADNKANMIAGISLLLMFLIISFLSAGDSEKLLNQIEIVLPLGILIVFCSVSAICAILALKPKIIRAKKESRSAIFFSNNYRKSLEEYTKQMNDLLASEKDIYDHMLRDMYYNGLVLERKYALLSFSYNIFLLAIVLSLSSYIIAVIA